VSGTARPLAGRTNPYDTTTTMTESEPTHRVVRKAHRRSSNDGGPALVYEPGDTITPTDRELERLPSRFERIERDDDEATTEPNSAAEQDEQDADDEPDESDEADAPDTADDAAPDADDTDDTPETDGPAPDPLTTAWVEAADYAGLRSAASRFDGINGNHGEDRLRAELLEQIDGGDA